MDMARLEIPVSGWTCLRTERDVMSALGVCMMVLSRGGMCELPHRPRDAPKRSRDVGKQAQDASRCIVMMKRVGNAMQLTLVDV